MFGYTLKIEPCRTCKGTGRNSAAGISCMICKGGKYEPQNFNLGPTRTYRKGRPAIYNPGTQELVVKRDKKLTHYTIREFKPDTVPGEKPMRAFAVRNEETGDVHHVKVGEPGMHTCDCGGATYESTQKANAEAIDRGEPLYLTWGCVHLDAILILWWDGMFDINKESAHAQS